MIQKCTHITTLRIHDQARQNIKRCTANMQLTPGINLKKKAEKCRTAEYTCWLSGAIGVTTYKKVLKLLVQEKVNVKKSHYKIHIDEEISHMI